MTIDPLAVVVGHVEVDDLVLEGIEHVKEVDPGHRGVAGVHGEVFEGAHLVDGDDGGRVEPMCGVEVFHGEGHAGFLLEAFDVIGEPAHAPGFESEGAVGHHYLCADLLGEAHALDAFGGVGAHEVALGQEEGAVDGGHVEAVGFGGAEDTARVVGGTVEPAHHFDAFEARFCDAAHHLGQGS